MENKEDLTMGQNVLMSIAQGNVGVVQVLIKIIEKDPIFINPLGIAILLTKSKSYAIWLVYKNMCNYDIDKTMKVLREWFDNSTKPLEEWCENLGVR